MTAGAGDSEQDPLGAELVKLSLAAWPHLPNLVPTTSGQLSGSRIPESNP